MEMNIRPALPLQTSSGKCFNEFKVPTNHASTSRDTLSNPLETQTNPMVSQNGQSNNDSRFLSGFATDQDFSSFSHGEEPSQNAAFVFQPLEGEADFLPDHNGILDIPSAGYINYQKEDGDSSWNTSQFEDLLNIPGTVPLASGQAESTVEAVSNENDAKEIDWMELAEDLCPGPMDANWNEILVDPTARSQLPQVPQSSSDLIVHQLQIQQQLSLPLREVPAVANPSTSAQSNKSRMRWTPELHEAFIEAVNHLGGSERATPKCVLTHMNDHMNVEGLTIQHVKSHLQKYRSARVKPESLEGNSGERTTTAEQLPSVDLRTRSATIIEALRIQMEVQKQLHEQLEIQRKLQLKIEEQGKYLLQMLENQKKMEQEKLNSLPNGAPEPNSPEGSGLDLGTGGSSPPPTKRAKLDDSLN